MFEFLDLDLKKYMDAASVAADQAFNAQAAQRANPLNPNLAGLIKPKTRARRGLAPDLVAVSEQPRSLEPGPAANLLFAMRRN